ncbi:MAG: GatB/YqeY domain-containing protein [Bacilli bacterium]
MIIEKIHDDNIQAMKSRDSVARGILSVILTKAKLLEVELRTKNIPLEDKDVFEIIQKTIKELHDEKEDFQKVNNLERVASIMKQEDILNAYLPKQLSKDEIVTIIQGLEDKSLPSVMKYFKANYVGKVDMSLVSQIVRSL